MATDSVVAGQEVYGGGWGLLWSANISDPAHPATGFIRYDGPFIKNLAAAPGYLYLATGDGLQVSDVSNPGAPVEVTKLFARPE
jgi:hypothetical protein